MVSWVVFVGVQMPPKKSFWKPIGSICVDFSDCALPKCKKLRLGEHVVSLSFTSLKFGDKITRGFNVLGFQCVFLKLFICSNGCACVVIVSFF